MIQAPDYKAIQSKLFDSRPVDPEELAITKASVSDHIRQLNFVSFSGGKDSTVVLQLVLSAFEKTGTGRKLYIITADTMMEIPYFNTYVESARNRLRQYIGRRGLNAEVVTVKPIPKNSFWVSVIGKGYPAASMGFRWCTGILKIAPIENFIKASTAGHDDYMVFVGVRSAESALRAKIYTQKDYKPHHFAPILNWSSHDVWEYLLTELCPWGDDHAELVQVYKNSSDECVYGEAQGVCIGNARYGCWACPLQKSSQLDMIGRNTNDSRYQELKRFKELLIGMAASRHCRSKIRRNGDPGCGPFLVEVRKKLLCELKHIETVTGWELITKEEELLIKFHWDQDLAVHDKTAYIKPTEPLFECEAT